MVPSPNMKVENPRVKGRHVMWLLKKKKIRELDIKEMKCKHNNEGSFT